MPRIVETGQLSTLLLNYEGKQHDSVSLQSMGQNIQVPPILRLLPMSFNAFTSACAPWGFTSLAVL